MKWTVAFAAALAVSVCAQNTSAQPDAAPAKNWSATLDGTCRRCVPAELIVKNLPGPLPKRAIIYGFTGEFAHRADAWLVNLDTGEITNWEAVSDDAGAWKKTTRHLGTVEPGALERLRASAAALWRSEPYNALSWYSPGTDEEDEVVSGSRLVAFSRFAPNDHDIVTAINSALPADAANTNGSFVIRGH